MKKAIVVLAFLAMASSVFAADNFVQRESDRSGVTGTLKMIGNSISGFFSSLGSRINSATSKRS